MLYTTLAHIAPALLAAQAKVKHAIKDSVNPHLRSKYADLGAVWDACREALHAHKIAVVQAPQGDGAKVELTTMLLHESGEYLSSTLTLIPVKPDPQGIGSAITYARRYGLAAMIGVIADDDDGTAASRPGASHASPPAPAQVSHPQARAEAPAAAPPSPPKTLTAKQRWNCAVALIREKAGAVEGDKLIAAITAKHAGADGKVLDAQRDALLTEIEAAAGPAKDPT